VRSVHREHAAAEELDHVTQWAGLS
jgi:hypothetical protein